VDGNEGLEAKQPGRRGSYRRVMAGHRRGYMVLVGVPSIRRWSWTPMGA